VTPFQVVLAEALAVDKDKVTPGLLGFVVVALLGLATYLLVRSMNRQLKKIDLPEDDQPPTSPKAPGPGA